MSRVHLGAIIGACVASTLLAAAPALADTTLGFDDIPSNTVLGTQTAASGVTFGTDAQGNPSRSGVVAANAAARSAPNLVLIGHAREAGTPYGELWADFSTAQQHVSVYLGDPLDPGTAATQQVTFEAYAGTTVATTQTVTINNGEPVDKLVTLSTPTASITAVHIADFATGGGLAIDDLSFGPTAATAPPDVSTGTSSNVGQTTATLSATINTHSAPTTAHFDYGTSTAYGSSTAAQQLPGQSGPQPLFETLTGLTPGTTYHYQAVAVGPSGSPITGGDQTFTTAPATPPRPTSLEAVEGFPIRTAVAHFDTRPDSATIDWGDRTPADPGRIIAATDGGYDVLPPASRGHVYAEEGTFQISVTASFGSSKQLTHFTAVINDAGLKPIYNPQPFPIQQGDEQTLLVGLFTDGALGRQLYGLSERDDDYSATIDWGDGTTSDGATDAPTGGLLPQNGGVWGRHRYDKLGRYTVTISLHDRGGSSATWQATQVEVVPKPPPSPCQKAYAGPGGSLQADLDMNNAVVDEHGSISQTLNFTIDNPAEGGSRSPMDFTLTASGCWVYGGGQGDNPLQWSTQAPLKVNDAFVLYPSDPNNPPILTVDGRTGTISAADSSGSGTSYDVGIPNSDGTLAVVGRIDLRAHPLTLTPTGNGTDTDVYGQFGESPNSPLVGGRHIAGGEIRLSTAGNSYGNSTVATHITAHVPLPAVFSSTPEGGQAPTGDINYDFPQTPAASGGGSAGCGSDPACISIGGGGYVDPECQRNPKQCNGGYKLAAADTPARGRRRALAHQAVTLPGEFLGHLPDIKVPEMWLGVVKITEVDLSHNDDTGEWDGTGKFDVIPGVLTMEASFAIDDQGNVKRIHAGFEWDPGIPLWEVPPVTLNGFDVGIGFHPTVMQGGIKLKVMDIVGIDGHVFEAAASPQEPYAFDDQLKDEIGSPILYPSPFRAPALGIGAEVTLDVPHFTEIKLGAGYALIVEESPGPYIEFGATASLAPSDYGLPDFVDDLISAKASIIGQIGHDPSNPQRSTFNFDGSLDAHIAGFHFGGEALVSSTGVAACVDASGPPLFVGHVGFGYAWNGSHTKIFWPVEGGCGVGDWSAQVAAAGGARTVDIRRGTSAASLRVAGQSAVPSVILTGPHGERFAVPATPGIGRRGQFTFLRSTATHTIYIGLLHPSPGRWMVGTAPGSAPITQLYKAYPLPSAHVTARVTGTGHTRTLHYALRVRAGQQVTFSERGRGANQQIGVARGSHGSIRFHPEGGPAGRRAIVAQVVVNGMPDAKLVPTHYRAPAPVRASRVRKVRVLRAGARAHVSWSATTGARRFVVSVALSDGRRLSFTRGTHSHSLTIAALKGPTTGTVRVAGLSPDSTPGPATTARIPAAAGPPRPSGLAAHRTRQGIVIRWHAVRGAVDYAVRVRLGAKQLLLLTRTTQLRPSQTLARRRIHARIEVRALDRFGSLGAPAVLRLR